MTKDRLISMHQPVRTVGEVAKKRLKWYCRFSPQFHGVLADTAKYQKMSRTGLRKSKVQWNERQLWAGWGRWPNTCGWRAWSHLKSTRRKHLSVINSPWLTI